MGIKRFIEGLWWSRVVNVIYSHAVQDGVGVLYRLSSPSSHPRSPPRLAIHARRHASPSTYMYVYPSVHPQSLMFATPIPTYTSLSPFHPIPCHPYHGGGDRWSEAPGRLAGR
jgi:hypothetical protein